MSTYEAGANFLPSVSGGPRSNGSTNGVGRALNICREYWMIYRGPGFLASYDLALPHPSDGRRSGMGWGKSRITRRRESLVLYNSFNTLCIHIKAPNSSTAHNRSEKVYVIVTLSVKTPYRIFTSVCMVHFSTCWHVFLFVYHLFANDGFFRWLIIYANVNWSICLQCKLPLISLQRYQWLYSKRNMVYCIGPCAGVDYTITSPYVDSRVDSNTCTTGNPLSQTRLYPPVKD